MRVDHSKAVKFMHNAKEIKIEESHEEKEKSNEKENTNLELSKETS